MNPQKYPLPLLPPTSLETLRHTLSLFPPGYANDQKREEIITSYLYSQDTPFTNATELLNHYCMQTYKVLPRYAFGQQPRLGKWEVIVSVPGIGDRTASSKTKKNAKNAAAMQILCQLGVVDVSHARCQKRITVPATLSAEEVALLVVVENITYQLTTDALLQELVRFECNVTAIVPRGSARICFPKILDDNGDVVFGQLVSQKVGEQNVEHIGPYCYLVRKCAETNTLCTLDQWNNFFGGFEQTRFLIYGEAYVFCATRDDVKKALRAHGTRLGDRRIDVHEAQQTGRSLEQGYVSVSGLHWETTRQEVEEFCSNDRQWSVLSVCPRNEALVVFASPEVAQDALAYFLHGQAQRADGTRWRCELHKKDASGNTLFLRGIPYNITSEAQFREYFPNALEFRIRGEALVQYEDWLHAKSALSWSKMKTLRGRIVHIKPARISRTPSPPESPEQTPQTSPAGTVPI